MSDSSGGCGCRRANSPTTSRKCGDTGPLPSGDATDAARRGRAAGYWGSSPRSELHAGAGAGASVGGDQLHSGGRGRRRHARDPYERCAQGAMIPSVTGAWTSSRVPRLPAEPDRHWDRGSDPGTATQGHANTGIPVPSEQAHDRPWPIAAGADGAPAAGDRDRADERDALAQGDSPESAAPTCSGALDAETPRRVGDQGCPTRWAAERAASAEEHAARAGKTGSPGRCSWLRRPGRMVYIIPDDGGR